MPPEHMRAEIVTGPDGTETVRIPRGALEAGLKGQIDALERAVAAVSSRPAGDAPLASVSMVMDAKAWTGIAGGLLSVVEALGRSNATNERIAAALEAIARIQPVTNVSVDAPRVAVNVSPTPVEFRPQIVVQPGEITNQLTVNALVQLPPPRPRTAIATGPDGAVIERIVIDGGAPSA